MASIAVAGVVGFVDFSVVVVAAVFVGGGVVCVCAVVCVIVVSGFVVLGVVAISGMSVVADGVGVVLCF